MNSHLTLQYRPGDCPSCFVPDAAIDHGYAAVEMQRTTPRGARCFVAAQVMKLSFCSRVASRALVDFGDVRGQELALTAERRDARATAAVDVVEIAERNPSVNASGDHERTDGEIDRLESEVEDLRLSPGAPQTFGGALRTSSSFWW
jgi:hypothetical protein